MEGTHPQWDLEGAWQDNVIKYLLQQDAWRDVQVKSNAAIALESRPACRAKPCCCAGSSWCSGRSRHKPAGGLQQGSRWRQGQPCSPRGAAHRVSAGAAGPPPAPCPLLVLDPGQGAASGSSSATVLVLCLKTAATKSLRRVSKSQRSCGAGATWWEMWFRNLLALTARPYPCFGFWLCFPGHFPVYCQRPCSSAADPVLCFVFVCTCVLWGVGGCSGLQNGFSESPAGLYDVLYVYLCT